MIEIQNIQMEKSDSAGKYREAIRIGELVRTIHTAIHRATSVEELCKMLSGMLGRVQRYRSSALVLIHPAIKSYVYLSEQVHGSELLINEWKRKREKLPCFDMCLRNRNASFLADSDKRCANCELLFLPNTPLMIPVSLTYQGERYGVLFVELTSSDTLELDELHLFESLGEDIAYCLGMLINEEQKQSDLSKLFTIDHNSSLVTFLLGDDKRITRCSESIRLWGYRMSDFDNSPLITQIFPELIPEEIGTQTVKLTTVVTATGTRTFAILFPVIHRDTTISIMAIDADPLMSELGKSVSYKPQEELISRLGLSINTLLSVITGNSAIIHDQLSSHNISFPEWDEIGQAAQKLKMILTDLSATQTIEPDTSIFLHDLIELIFPKITELIPNRIQLSWPTTTPSLSLPITRSTLETVLLAIIKNSVESIPNSGTISTSFDELTINSHCRFGTAILLPGTYLKISVEDSGSGICEEHIGSVFDPFFTTKSRVMFTGMGLTSVRQILHSIGGGIEINSRENDGTTVSIMIPSSVGYDERNAPAPAVSLAKSENKPYKVIVVDDETVICSVMAKSLKLLGYESETFTHGKAAIQRLRESDGERLIVLTDFLMPEMDGEMLTIEIRKLFPDLPVIFHTADTRTKVLQDLISMHGWKNVFRLNKPTLMNELESLLSHVISLCFENDSVVNR